MSDIPSDIEVLDRLFAVITARAGADAGTSYTARLLAGGPPAIGQKVGEEAFETVIAALNGDTAPVVRESADLIYHLMVLWAATGVAPADVWAELARREGVSGIAEKAGRPGRTGRAGRKV